MPRQSGMDTPAGKPVFHVSKFATPSGFGKDNVPPVKKKAINQEIYLSKNVSVIHLNGKLGGNCVNQ